MYVAQTDLDAVLKKTGLVNISIDSILQQIATATTIIDSIVILSGRFPFFEFVDITIDTSFVGKDRVTTVTAKARGLNFKMKGISERI